MATVQEPRGGSRYDSFVEAELVRARRRIRAQDVAIAALGLLAGTLGYTLGMVVLDRWLQLSDAVRQIALFGYFAAAVAFAATVLSRPFRREVNPYFAARRVEQAVPGAKNSVISWLDLHEEPLPESIRAAVTAKAAADLKRADVDTVVSDARLPWIGGLAGGLFVAALILFFLLRPNQFLSLLARTFTPFGSWVIATQTSLTLLQPAAGDLTIPLNTPVDFRVEVLGRLPDSTAPDAVRLRFRYNPADPVAEEIRLEPTLRESREFVVRVPANRVQNGFVYQIVAGDAATPEYRIQVRSSPLIEVFEAVYHFRPYLRFRDQTVTNPNLEALRGTTVTLTARTNRTVKGGVLEFQPIREGQQVPAPVQAESVPDQPTSLRFRFVMDEDATYKIRFQSADGERNDDPIPYTIRVLNDHAPQVEVTHPAPDTLPVNGTIAVEGKATDDYGITAMRLCLQLADASRPTPLACKPYRPEKVFKFADDTYPRGLDYKDFLPLDQLKTTLGAPVTLRPGVVIEYWLEAVDNCEPKPNVGKSKVYKVTLADPQAADEKQAADKQAAGEKARHDQKPDQDLDRQNQEKKEQQAGEMNDKGEKNDQGQPGADQKDQSKEGDQGNGGDDAKDKQVEKELQKAKEALDRQQRREQGQNGKGDGKQDGQPQNGDQPKNPADPKSEQGNKDGNNQPGEQKNQPGDKNGQQQQPKEGQPGSKSDGQQPSGEKQAAQPQPKDGRSESKPDGQQNQGEKQTPQPDKGAGQPNAGDKNQAGQPKPEGANGGQPQSQPKPQDGPPNGGDKNDQQQGQKSSGSDKKSGNDQSKSGGEPNAGNPPGNNGQNNRPGKLDGKSPTQPPNDPGNTKATNENRPPSDQPKKDGAENKGEQKQESGAGGQPGSKNQSGERPGTGPKGDPNSREPNGPANENDPGRDGAGSKTGSGQAGGTPDKPQPKSLPDGQGQGGAPDAGNGKPQDKPAGTEKGDGKTAAAQPNGDKSGQPGGGNGQGTLQDAAKGGHNQPGGATQSKPTTGGTASNGAASGKQSGDKTADQQSGSGGSNADRRAAEALNKLAHDLKSGDPKTRQAAENQINELAKQLARQGDGQKSGDPQAVKDAAERAKEMLKRLDQDPEARQALENAMKGAAERTAMEELQKLARDLKSADPQTREAARDRAREMAKGDLKDLADAARSDDPQRRQAAKDALEKLGQQDPATRDALAEALKGDGRPDERQDKSQGGRNPIGRAPDKDGQDSTDVIGQGPPPEKNNSTSDLQLEKFPKNPSRELLKDLGMTEEQYRQFLKDAAALQTKRQAEMKDNRQRGSDAGKSAANTGARRVQVTGDKKGEIERGGAALPPEEYRDGYKGYTEDVSKSSGGPKKD